MEALVILIPPLIALLIGAWAVFAPRRVDPVAELARLEAHIARLEDSLGITGVGAPPGGGQAIKSGSGSRAGDGEGEWSGVICFSGHHAAPP